MSSGLHVQKAASKNNFLYSLHGHRFNALLPDMKNTSGRPFHISFNEESSTLASRDGSLSMMLNYHEEFSISSCLNAKGRL